MANLSVDQLRPCPTGRVFFLNAFQAVNCLATITGPSGTKPSPRPVHKICSTSSALQPRTFEDSLPDVAFRSFRRRGEVIGRRRVRGRFAYRLTALVGPPVRRDTGARQTKGRTVRQATIHLVVASLCALGRYVESKDSKLRTGSGYRARAWGLRLRRSARH